MMKLRRDAWRPAAMRTLDASYIVIRETMKQRAKRLLLVPSLTPTAVVRPTMRAEWEEGMPPEPTARDQSHLPCSYLHPCPASVSAMQLLQWSAGSPVHASESV